MATDSKAPIKFVVFNLKGDEVAFPPAAMEDAGGNRVTIVNMIEKQLTVYHGGNLNATDPFTVPARSGGGPPRVTKDISANSDKSGTVFSLRIEASIVRALGGPGDPTIIIL